MNTLLAVLTSFAIIFGNVTHAPDDNGTITVAPGETIEIRNTECGIVQTIESDYTGMWSANVDEGTYMVMPQSPNVISNNFIVEALDNCTMKVLK